MPRELKLWMLSDGRTERYIVAHSVAEACRLINDDDWFKWNCGPKHFKDYAYQEPRCKGWEEAKAKGLGIYPVPPR